MDEFDQNNSTLEMSDVNKCVDKIAQMLCVPHANVFPTKNYTDEVEVDESVNVLALLAMRQAVTLTEDYIKNALKAEATKHDVAEPTGSDSVD